jgi:hypothetical protein
MPQSQGFVRSIEGTIFSRPPCDQFKDGGQIDVDCVPVPASLTFLPRVPKSQQVLPQCLGCVRYIALDRFPYPVLRSILHDRRDLRPSHTRTRYFRRNPKRIPKLALSAETRSRAWRAVLGEELNLRHPRMEPSAPASIDGRDFNETVAERINPSSSLDRK